MGRSEKGLAADWTRPEGTEVLKLRAEPPKIRGYSSQFDTRTKNSQTDIRERGGDVDTGILGHSVSKAVLIL